MTSEKKNRQGKREKKRANNKQGDTSEEEETINRQFGMTPVPYCPRCKKLGRKAQRDGKKINICPSCQKVLEERPKLIPNDVFIRFKKVVNVMIRRGRNMPLKYFRGTGAVDTKKFYNRIITDPQVKKIAEQSKLHNRLQRCAAQYAYYSIQEYRRRQLMVRELTIIVEDMLLSKEGLDELADSDFPSYQVVKYCQGHLRTFNEHNPLKRSTESTFMQNMLRHVRNILQEQVKTRSMDQDTLAEQ